MLLVVCACIIVGLVIKVFALAKAASAAPQVDQAKRAAQYEEMDENQNQPSASVPKEMVVIENPKAIGDDLSKC